MHPMPCSDLVNVDMLPLQRLQHNTINIGNVEILFYFKRTLQTSSNFTLYGFILPELFLTLRGLTSRVPVWREKVSLDFRRYAFADCCDTSHSAAAHASVETRLARKWEDSSLAHGGDYSSKNYPKSLLARVQRQGLLQSWSSVRNLCALDARNCGKNKFSIYVLTWASTHLVPFGCAKQKAFGEKALWCKKGFVLQWDLVVM